MTATYPRYIGYIKTLEKARRGGPLTALRDDGEHRAYACVVDLEDMESHLVETADWNPQSPVAALIKGDDQ